MPYRQNYFCNIKGHRGLSSAPFNIGVVVFGVFNGVQID